MAARESDKTPEKAPDKAMDGLLRHTLRNTPPNATPPSDPCPDPEILAAYFERSLDDREIAEYELHLSRCAHCREQQAAMARAHPPARATEEGKPRRAWLWDWRWLAPAMAVLALATIWYARRPAPTAEKSQLPYLAMSRSAEPPASALSENTPAPVPAVPPSAPPNEALKNAEREEKDSRAAAARMPTENEAREIAARKAASDLASNIETDAVRKDTDALGRDAGAPASATPAPAPLSTPQAETAVSSAANASSAVVKTQQAETPALTRRSINLAVERHSIETLIHTSNPQVLWRLTSTDFVERSVDGGATWMGQLPSAGAQLTAGSAPAEKICWLVGRDAVILLTTNAVEWKTIRPPAKTDFTGVVAKDALEATLSAADGRKFTTKDGGESWKPVH